MATEEEKKNISEHELNKLKNETACDVVVSLHSLPGFLFFSSNINMHVNWL